MFELAPELKRDCIELADWPLCKVLLLNDSQYPWFILVPRQNDLKEIVDLSEQEQIVFIKESAMLSKLIQEVFNPDKLNVAAIGNMVPQLHIHHIARFKTDAVWPAPVRVNYQQNLIQMNRLVQSLISLLIFNSLPSVQFYTRGPFYRYLRPNTSAPCSKIISTGILAAVNLSKLLANSAFIVPCSLTKVSTP